MQKSFRIWLTPEHDVELQEHFEATGTVATAKLIEFLKPNSLLVVAPLLNGRLHEIVEEIEG